MAEQRLVINGREYEIPTGFKLGEVADVERITGQEYDVTKPGALGMLGMIYIAMRRADPRVTIDDVRNLDMDAITFVGGDDSPPEEQPASSSGHDEPAQTSTDDSNNGSEPNPAETPAPTGSPA